MPSAVKRIESLFSLSQLARQLYQAEEADADPVRRFAARLRAMDFQTAFPILLHLCAYSKSDLADVTQACIYLESFLVRRMVCGLNTRGYGTFFVGVLAAIGGRSPVAPVLRDALLGSKADAARWPDDAEFAAEWCSRPLYRDLRRDRLKMVLRALEVWLRDPKLSDPVPIPKTLHVEHVMPRSWQAHWPLLSDVQPQERDAAIDRIGNLTLLTKNLNQTLSNGPWTVGAIGKRYALKDHGLLVLNLQLAKEDNWNEQTIAARGKTLLKAAIANWPYATG